MNDKAVSFTGDIQDSDPAPAAKMVPASDDWEFDKTQSLSPRGIYEFNPPSPPGNNDDANGALEPNHRAQARKKDLPVLSRRALPEKPVLDQQLFDKRYGFRRVDLTLGRKVHWYFRQIGKWAWPEWCHFFSSRVPISRWIRSYKWREWIAADIIGGLMVSIMSVPQGLAYGYLVGVPPNYGLITSIFAPFIYALLGTSRHTSPGSFAIVALMVGSAVEQFGGNTADVIAIDHGADMLNKTCCSAKTAEVQPEEAVGIACAITLMIGIFQIIFGLLNAGLLAVWLSDHLVQGLTSGAAVHVLTSQLKSMSGITGVPPTSEPFGLIKFYICFVKQISTIQLNSSMTSLVSIFLLLTSSYFIDPILRKWTNMKFPMEFFLVFGSSLLVWLSVDTRYQLTMPIVGKVKSGLDRPFLPPLDRAGDMFGMAISIAVISFVVHIALAKLVSKKLNYEIDANQEWLALGSMHAFSSFFGCFAGGSSLGRTMMQVKYGTNSQISTLVSCCVLLLFVHGAASLIYYLPKAVLACIVVIAMKDLFIQMIRAVQLYKESIVDFLILTVTLVSVILINVNIGLVVGVTFALLSVVFRTQWAESTCMGRIPGTSDFKGLSHYKKAEEIPGVKVFRFDAPLYFANSELFIMRMYQACGINPILVRSNITDRREAEQKRKAKLNEGEKKDATVEEQLVSLHEEAGLELRMKGQRVTGENEKTPLGEEEKEVTDEGVHDELTHIIIDCSSISYVDLMGKDALAQVYADYDSINIVVLMSHCKVAVRQMFETSDFYLRVPKSRLFVSLDDAVTLALRERAQRFNDSRPPPATMNDTTTKKTPKALRTKNPIAKSPQKTQPRDVKKRNDGGAVKDADSLLQRTQPASYNSNKTTTSTAQEKSRVPPLVHGSKRKQKLDQKMEDKTQ